MPRNKIVEDAVTVAFVADKAQWEAIRKIANNQQQTVSSVMRRAIDLYLKVRE